LGLEAGKTYGKKMQHGGSASGSASVYASASASTFVQMLGLVVGKT
jgi:hypothetical protein